MAASEIPASRRAGPVRHESFLRLGGYRWLWVALLLCMACGAAYLTIPTPPRPRGGSALGYALGVAGALLIIWLTLFGLRKRVITSGPYSLKAWLSAHVYLGVALLVIATLHAGFHFGLNVHTLAYGLMVVVIVSGLFGATAYAVLPQALSANRQETTQQAWLAALRTCDGQLRDAAQPLGREAAEAVRRSVETTDIGGGVWSRLTGQYPHCATRRAAAGLAALKRGRAAAADPALDWTVALLADKQAILDRARRHIRIRALLEIWLFVHVPMTFALLAALTAHIVSVFFYW
jgi:hypothetical protein